MIKTYYVCPICLACDCLHDSDEIEDFMGKSHMISCGEFCDTCLINVRIELDE